MLTRTARLPQQDVATMAELAEVLTGLSGPRKMLPPKLFYDERGSALFDAICELPEYYPTRTELRIMRTHIRTIAGLVGPRACVIELGSGSSLKTRILLEHLHEPVAYIPVDISKEHLLASARALAGDFPAIEILPVAADFTRPFALPSPRTPPRRRLVYFPGSTVGNFSPGAAHRLLRLIHHAAEADGALLIGIDLRKDPAILHRAYNDRAGVTAEFNLNMLRRLNREYGADFRPDRFRHRALWNEEHGRVEMQLVSVRDQSVHIGGCSFRFRRGEPVVTEHSHKFAPSEFDAMANRAGFRVVDAWTDRNDWFSVRLYTPRRDNGTPPAAPPFSPCDGAARK